MYPWTGQTRLLGPTCYFKPVWICAPVFISVFSTTPLLSAPLLLLSAPQASLSVWEDRKIPLGVFIIATQLWIRVRVWNGLCRLSPSLGLACFALCNELTALHIMSVCASRSWWINSICVSERKQNLSSPSHSCIRLLLSNISACLSAYLSTAPPPYTLHPSLSLSFSLIYPQAMSDLKGRGWKHKLTTESEWVTEAERRGKWRDRPCKRDGRKRLSPISIW